MTAPMTRADVDRIVSEDRANATTPDLRGANLRGANLGDANLWGANLRDAKANSHTVWPDGFDPQAAGVRS